MAPVALAALLACATAGCRHAVEYYCDEDTPCLSRYPERPYCDLTGQYPASEGIGRTCIPFPDDPNVDFCLSSPDCPAARPICQPDLTCRGCVEGGSGDAECTDRSAETPRCSSNGTCVECLDAADCGGTYPVCEPSTAACRPCQTHAECASDLCHLESGACVDAAEIVYVSVTGADGSSCGDQASPCLTISGSEGGLTKVNALRSYIRLDVGTFDESVTVDGVSLSIIGQGTAQTTVQPPTSGVPGMLVVNGANLRLEGVTVRGATGGYLGDGVQCRSESTLTLSNVALDANEGSGLDLSACETILESSRIRGNGQEGCSAVNGGAHVVEVRRSVIQLNDGGGFAVNNYNFRLVNSFIADNGSTTSSSSGGIFLGDAPNGIAVISFNTIANNSRRPTDFAGGIYCGSTAALAATNNIVWGNSPEQVVGNCSFTYSDIQGGLNGTGNIDVLPQFVQTLGDYHIQELSPCRNAADPDAVVADDVDGESRPESGRADIGADEYWP